MKKYLTSQNLLKLVMVLLVIFGMVGLTKVAYNTEEAHGFSMYMNCYSRGEMVYSNHFTREEYFGSWFDKDGFADNGFPKNSDWVCGREYYE